MKYSRLLQALFFLGLSALFFSCSLKYDSGFDAESVLPEFTFNDVKFTRFEEKDKKAEMIAGQLEQYKDGNTAYGKNVLFSVYNDKEELETEGSCTFIGIDSDKEIYELYENIKIHNLKQNLDVSGKKFRWNGKNEQLTAGRNDMVTISKDGMTIHGSGFSASGVSSSFNFTGVVTGDIVTKDDDGEENADEE